MIKEMMSRRPMASASDSMSFDMPSVLWLLKNKTKNKKQKDDNYVVHGCGTLGRAANTHHDERRGLGNGSRPSALTLPRNAIASADSRSQTWPGCRAAIGKLMEV